MKNQRTTYTLRAWSSLVLCLPLALLGACASGEKPKPAAVQAVIQAPGKSYVTVSDANDGASVVLDAGQELRVNLSLSAFEVANNMDWLVTDLKPGTLAVLGSRFERSGRDNNSTDSDGSTNFRLKPQSSGRFTLSFALRREYSLGAPTRALNFDVTVK